MSGIWKDLRRDVFRQHQGIADMDMLSPLETKMVVHTGYTEKEHMPGKIAMLGKHVIRYASTSRYIFDSGVRSVNAPTVPVGNYDPGDAYIELYDSGLLLVVPSVTARKMFFQDRIATIQNQMRAKAERDLEQLMEEAAELAYEPDIVERSRIEEKHQRERQRKLEKKKRAIKVASPKARAKRQRKGKMIDVKSMVLGQCLWATFFPPKRASMKKIRANVLKLKNYIRTLSKKKITVDIAPEATEDGAFHINIFAYFHEELTKSDKATKQTRLLKSWCRYWNNTSLSFRMQQKFTAVKSHRHLRNIIDYSSNEKKKDGTKGLIGNWGKVYKQSHWDLLPHGKKRIYVDIATALEMRADLAKRTGGRAPNSLAPYARMCDQDIVNELGTKYNVPIGEPIDGVKRMRCPVGITFLRVTERGRITVEILHKNEVDLPVTAKPPRPNVALSRNFSQSLQKTYLQV